MKKWMCVIMSVLLCASLCACNTQTSAGNTARIEGVFSAGFGKGDITPQEPVPLGSYGHSSSRICNGYLENLYSLTLALTDEEGNTLLLIVTDLSEGYLELATELRRRIGEKYGIPGEYIILSGTHNHSAPDTDLTENGAIVRYMSLWYEATMESVEKAMKDRAPATMYAGSTEAEGLTFVRRYWMENGQLMGNNYNDSPMPSPITEHESEADDEVQMVRFDREGAKDILLANFQAHNTKVGDTLEASSGFVGRFRMRIEEEMDMHCMFIQGAAGNLDPKSRIEGECVTLDHIEHGRLLAGYVIKALDSLEQIETGKIRVRQTQYAAQVNHAEDSLVPTANQVLSYWEQTQDNMLTNQMCQPLGIGSHHHASALIIRSRLGQTEDLELNAVSIGQLALVTQPLEMFAQSGMYIKENSPFAMTLIVGYANAYGTYMPPQECFPNSGYEVHNCMFVAGTAEIMDNTHLQLLDELYAAS